LHAFRATVAGSTMSRPQAGKHGLRLLQFVLFRVDAILRRTGSVIEFTRDSDCIFRIQIGRLHQDVLLSDGTSARCGERVLNLHFWNEHLPLMLDDGPSMGWARRMSRCVEQSLQSLAGYLAGRSEFDDIRLLRANITFSSPERHTRLMRVCRRFGFEEVADRAPVTMMRSLHVFGENILTSLIFIALQASAPRDDTLHRDRTQLFLSRRWVMHRYGREARLPCSKPERNRRVA
jgi:hypothetical protein